MEWLGDVPAHWDVVRAKTLLRAIDVRSETGTEELLTVSSARGVVPRQSATVTMFKAQSYVGYKLCWHGDLVINSLWAWARGLGVARHHGIISSAYGVYRSKDVNALNPLYLDALVRSQPFQWELQVRSKGIWISRLQLTDEAFLNAPMPLPPPEEQAAIVRFLDHADRKIRRAIRVKQKLVKLLEEEKQAIIHRAVTRGLDPNIHFKPSGVEWLGDVPEHWEIVRFKRRVGFQEGPGIMAADFRDGGVPLLRISCLQGEFATLDGCNFLDPEMVLRKWKHFAVLATDYLLSASASTGTVVPATEEVAGAIPYTGILRLWSVSDLVFMPFVRFYVGSQPFQEQIDMAKSGVAIEHFGPTHLKRMWVALPTRSEQEVIVRFIESRLAPLAAAAANAESAIKVLREYRTRLIADVVTGKLDVREAAARLPDEVEKPEEQETSQNEPSAEDETETAEANQETLTEEAEG